MQKQTIKQILQEQISFHKEEIKKHSLLFKEDRSIRQREKRNKHYGQLTTVQLIAKKLNFDCCEHCGGLK